MALPWLARSRTDPIAAGAGSSAGMMHSVHRYPAFRMVLLGTLATNTAFWMYQIAVGWLALEMTDSPFFVGLAGFVGGIPLLILSLPAGVMVDRIDRRRVLLFAQAGVMVVAGVFALCVAFDLLERWSLLLLVTVYGSAMSFVFPTRTAIVGSLVQREHLGNAIALNSATQNATRIVGPSLAGVFIAIFGAGGTFAIAALLQILAMRTTLKLPPAIADPDRRREGWRSLTVGLKVVAASPVLTALIVLALAPTVLVMPYLNLMPVFARDELDLGAVGLGLLLACVGVGTVIGALGVARSQSLRTIRAGQLKMAAIFAVLVLVFSVAPNPYLAAPLLFAAGFMSAAYLAINQTSLQMNVDDDVRGRVLSIYLLTWGMLPLGQLGVGALADVIGSPEAMALSCIAALASIVIIARRFPSLRD